MQFPLWATPGENRKLFGKAKANGADELTLSDFDATTGFLLGNLPPATIDIDVEIVMKNTASRVRVTLNPAGEDGYQNQVAKFFNDYAKPLPRNIDFSHFVLTDGAGTLILGRPTIRLDEKLYFRLPSTIQPESASNWTSQYLSLLGIEFEDYGLNAGKFLSDLPSNSSIPEDNNSSIDLLNELKFLTPELIDEFVNNSNVYNNSFKILENNNIIKSACMLAKFGNNEAAVDIFLVFLFQKIGFYSNRLFAFPQMRHSITFGEVKKEAIPDFTIIDVLSYFRIAVIEDKSEDSNDAESKTEAQLVAEAISIFQANQRMRKNSIDEKQEGEQALKRSKASSTNGEQSGDVEDGAFSDEVVLGVRVKGLKFTFYVIPISIQIQTAIHTKSASVTETIVKKCGPFDFQFSKAQNNVVQVLRAYHRIITTMGEKSKRRNSDANKSI